MDSSQGDRDRFEFAGLRIQLATDWVDITHDLDSGSPPTLAKPTGFGAFQFTVARYVSGDRPNIGAVALADLLQDFALRRGPTSDLLESPRRVGANLITAGSFRTDTEFIRAWSRTGITLRSSLISVTPAEEQTRCLIARAWSSRSSSSLHMRNAPVVSNAMCALLLIGPPRLVIYVIICICVSNIE